MLENSSAKARLLAAGYSEDEADSIIWSAKSECEIIDAIRAKIKELFPLSQKVGDSQEDD
jgi:hypothetical protein